MWLVTWPTKLLTAPVIDAFGTSSWDVMLRHTELLFESEQELKSSPLTNAATTQHNLAELPAHGGLSQFLEMLATKIQADPTANWEITLVGHSMGTIVANKIIERFGDRLPIKNILYLAAADTVQHYQQAIYPYLQQNDTHGLHHFMLHPQAEEGEISLGMPWDIPPRGSLLVWIDNFLSKPLTGTDRTVGRYDNLLPALHNAPSDIRDRISVKVFSAGNPVELDNPLGHGVGRKFLGNQVLGSDNRKRCCQPNNHPGGSRSRKNGGLPCLRHEPHHPNTPMGAALCPTVAVPPFAPGLRRPKVHLIVSTVAGIQPPASAEPR